MLVYAPHQAVVLHLSILYRVMALNNTPRLWQRRYGKCDEMAK